MLCSRTPRSTTIPVAGSGVPRTVTSARNEWPWISSLSAPKVVPGSECAASKRNDFVNSHILKTKILSDTEGLVGLQAEPPLRMLQAIIHRARGVGGHVGPVHGLQRKALEGEIFERLRRRVLLRIDQLPFVSVAHHEVGARLRADA